MNEKKNIYTHFVNFVCVYLSQGNVEMFGLVFFFLTINLGSQNVENQKDF